jgi:hypothetical protein
MIVYNSKIAKLLKVGGITLWPFIFIAASEKDCPAWLLKHEQVHIRQQLNWLIIPFYVVYLWDYFKGRLKGYTHDLAYRSIRFEVEAYKKSSP